MLLLKQRKAGLLWARHIRCLGIPAEEPSSENHHHRTFGQVLLSSTRLLSQFAEATKGHTKEAEKDTTPKQLDRAKLSELQPVKPQSTSVYPFGSFYNSGNGQDLRRFLEEVGTDPKEARFWLKHFKRSSGPLHPFAVVQVDSSVFRDQEVKKTDLSEFLKTQHLEHETVAERFFELNKLASALSFLNRNSMKCVVIHGEMLTEGDEVTSQQLQVLRAEASYQSMLLASILELHGAPARPLFAGSNIIQATPTEGSSLEGQIVGINLDPVHWAMQSNHIPIIQAVGESFSGQMLRLNVATATAQISRSLEPLKVLFINTTGGIQDEKGEVIANINMPTDIIDKPWVTPAVRKQLDYVAGLLDSLPRQSSVVFTSANKLLAELFSHHGSGTFFKITEPILKYNSLKGIDKRRLVVLINKSFGKDLDENYLDHIEDRLHTLYLSEDYNSAAIITTEEGTLIPYLDKFAVGVLKQGEGVGDVLWECIRKDFKKLFWRSKNTNQINPWYFKRCEGSWSDGQWIVFWYGSVAHKESSALIERAVALPNSFVNTDSGEEGAVVERA